MALRLAEIPTEFLQEHQWQAALVIAGLLILLVIFYVEDNKPQE